MRMNRPYSENLQKARTNEAFDTFGENESHETTTRTSASNKELGQNKGINVNSEIIRLYVTIQKGSDRINESKKLIITTSVNIKISVLKRQIEREFNDLFPKEQPFTCGKLEDQYGYLLSNSSYVCEMIKNGDRITAYSDDAGDSSSIKTEQKNIPNIHASSDVNEILYLLRNTQQNLCRKLADGDIEGYLQPDEILFSTIPLGFSSSRVIVHNVAIILMKTFSKERLFILEGESNSKMLKLLVTLLNFWVGELISSDNFLLGHVINLLDILVKSATFCENFKGAFVISSLMNASNLDFISSQNKTAIVKIIATLTKGTQANYYNLEKNETVAVMAERNLNHTRAKTPNKTRSLSTEKFGYNHGSEMKRSSKEDNIVPKYDVTYSYDKPIRVLVNNVEPETKAKALVKTYPEFALNNKQPEVDVKIYRDYISLLTPDNTREMHILAMQNLDLIIDKAIISIMDSKEDYLKCLNLIEIELPEPWESVQLKILETLNQNLNEKRAKDGLEKNIVPRLLKALSRQSEALHSSFMSLMQSHLIKGRYRIDVSTIISIILSPYSKLHEFAMKALSIMSNPNLFERCEIQFENHMKLLIDLTVSRNKSYDFKNVALETLANLCLKKHLKSQILQNRGLEVLLFHLRNDSNLEGQRIAAVAIFNFGMASHDVKLKILNEIGDEIKKLQQNELDPYVQEALEKLINSK